MARRWLLTTSRCFRLASPLPSHAEGPTNGYRFPCRMRCWWRQVYTLGTLASVIRVPHWTALQLITAATYAMEFFQGAGISVDANRLSDIERTLLADLSAAVIQNSDPAEILSC